MINDKKIALYGAPRSGTNFVQDLIDFNWKATSNTDRALGCWKHGVMIEPLGGGYRILLS